ncbi:MAG: hypothetical protein JOZ77_09195 [Candidatus Eremiobacteraeota bacterium]|nr:hypothetical protein [Candidatus Eremiobacteraeota bacterium]
MLARPAPTLALAASLGVTGCGGHAVTALPESSSPFAAHSAATPITHIVLVIQENRSFNDFFATFPGVTGTTTGKMRTGTGSKAKTEPISLKRVSLLSSDSLNHTYPAYKTAYRDGNMDAFNLIERGTGKTEGSAPYQYVDPQQIQPYWTLASQYAIADKLFQTQGSESFTAHQDLIRGDTRIGPKRSIIDIPTHFPWGCNAPPGTATSVISNGLVYERDKGPYPCFSYTTLADLLDSKKVSWKYYTPSWRNSAGAQWSAFLAVSAIFKNKDEWNAHVSTPPTNFFTDVANDALPAMSWVIPDGMDSDHPGYGSDTGPSWVADIVNAIGDSRYWNSTAIVVTWDDWGGFYDPVKPPKLDDQGGPGFRVPMIVISPYVPKNEISHTVYEFGSIVRFIEDTWQLGRLGTTDATTTSIANIFRFGHRPRRFEKIPATYSRSFFLRRPPSGVPVDDE